MKPWDVCNFGPKRWFQSCGNFRLMPTGFSPAFQEVCKCALYTFCVATTNSRKLVWFSKLFQAGFSTSRIQKIGKQNYCSQRGWMYVFWLPGYLCTVCANVWKTVKYSQPEPAETEVLISSSSHCLKMTSVCLAKHGVKKEHTQKSCSLPQVWWRISHDETQRSNWRKVGGKASQCESIIFPNDPDFLNVPPVTWFCAKYQKEENRKSDITWAGLMSVLSTLQNMKANKSESTTTAPLRSWAKGAVHWWGMLGGAGDG